MSFGTAISTVLRKYAEFEGRASRPEYWWFALFSVLGSLALGSIYVGLAGAWSVAMLLPGLAVSVRRLRDAGYHWGWLFLLFLPFVGLVIVIVFLAQPSKQWSTAEPPLATRVEPQV